MKDQGHTGTGTLSCLTKYAAQLSVCLLLVSGCVRNQHGPRVGLDVRAELIRELEARASAHPLPDSTTTVFTDQRSSVIPGVTYHWAEFFPAGRVHVRFIAVIAVRDAQYFPLRVPGDWLNVKADFLPQSSGETLETCLEWVSTTAPIRAPDVSQHVIAGDNSLQNLPLPLPDRNLLEDSLSSPQIRQLDGGSWVANFWSIGPNIVRRYECTLHQSEGSLVVQDSLPGLGYYW